MQQCHSEHISVSLLTRRHRNKLSSISLSVLCFSVFLLYPFSHQMKKTPVHTNICGVSSMFFLWTVRDKGFCFLPGFCTCQIRVSHINFLTLFDEKIIYQTTKHCFSPLKYLHGNDFCIEMLKKKSCSKMTSLSKRFLGTCCIRIWVC